MMPTKPPFTKEMFREPPFWAWIILPFLKHEWFWDESNIGVVGVCVARMFGKTYVVDEYRYIDYDKMIAHTESPTSSN